MGYLDCVIVVFEVNEVCVDEGVVDVSVAQDPHYVEDVLGFVVFHGRFEVSERVEGDLVDPRVVQLRSHFLALALEDSPLVPDASREHLVGLSGSLKLNEHCPEFVGYSKHPRVATLLRGHPNCPVSEINIYPSKSACLAYSNACFLQQLEDGSKLPGASSDQLVYFGFRWNERQFASYFLYLGGFHVRSCILRKQVYASAALTFLLLHHSCLAMASLTDSGSNSSAPRLTKAFSSLTLVTMVLSA